jgi:hypothetical protein|tara:strand:- start:425 stop:652 length:228 start_codon:yes stop_codon:yes gene_type:complete
MKMNRVELCEDDYVILKNNKPIEPFHVIYHKTSVDEIIWDRGLNYGEKWVRMTELPNHLQSKYIEEIKRLEYENE